MAAFTTWADLRTKMLDDLASGSWRTSEYTIPGRSVRKNSFADFREALEYVTMRADIEDGQVAARTCARPRRS